MAIESIAEEYARFLGYLTETRVPFKLKRSHSDIDILGFNPRTKASLVIECKAWGGPEDYTDFSSKHKWFRDKFREIIEKWHYFVKSPTNKWKFSKLNEVWFIIPGFCSDKSSIETEISKALKCNLKIMPIHELLLYIMFKVREDKGIRRKRYSNPALEFCRWLLRGYEKGHLSLIDVDVRLKGEKRTYELLKRNYFRECLRIVQSNVEKREAFVHTRIKSLACLSSIGKGRISKIEKQAKRKSYDLNYNRIVVGLGTWIKLGLVGGNNKDGFFILDPYKGIVKKELESIFHHKIK